MRKIILFLSIFAFLSCSNKKKALPLLLLLGSSETKTEEAATGTSTPSVIFQEDGTITVDNSTQSSTEENVDPIQEEPEEDTAEESPIFVEEITEISGPINIVVPDGTEYTIPSDIETEEDSVVIEFGTITCYYGPMNEKLPGRTNNSHPKNGFCYIFGQSGEILDKWKNKGGKGIGGLIRVYVPGKGDTISVPVRIFFGFKPKLGAFMSDPLNHTPIEDRLLISISFITFGLITGLTLRKIYET